MDPMNSTIPRSTTSAAGYILAMAVVVVLSNVLVQFPVHIWVGSVQLADILTWGAFTYPAAFFVNDLTNRRFGAAKARFVVAFGFIFAVVCSATIPPLLFSMGLFPFEIPPERLLRIAVASGSAFLVAQLLDIWVFDQLRQSRWWKAPLISSLLGSVIDTFLFFSLAFAAGFSFLGQSDEFALEIAPLLGIFAMDTARWVSWAIGDLGVKVLVGLLLLIPYGYTFRRRQP